MLGFEVRTGNIDIYDQKIHDKIKAALKLLPLRVQYVLVQFWSTFVIGKQHQLTTIDQPFGFGLCDERLVSYRWDSECKIYDVNRDYDEEEDISPPVRVFRQGLPEWSLNVNNYLPKHFPQQECAIRCNLHGYLALPVFDATTCRLRVGVIELLMSSMYAIPSFHYEVQQIQNALKEQDLTCLQVCGANAANINHEGRQNDLNKIFDLLKVVCDTHRLPLAQTWALSPSASVASHEQALETVDKETHMAEPNNYITATQKNFVSNDNEGRMVKKCIVKIQGTFLEKIRNDAFNGNKGENAYEHINKFLDVVGPIKINGLTQDRFRLSIFPISLTRAAYEWFTKECMGSIATWDSMVEKFIMKFHHLSDHNDDEDVKEEEDPNETNNAPEIFMIEGNLFDFETPLYMAFNEFNCLLKIDIDLFTYDIQDLKTYDEYEQELNNDEAKGTDEPCSTLGGQGNLRIKVRTGGGDVERLGSELERLWCKVEVCGGLGSVLCVAAEMSQQGEVVA
ncbi:hypothetical protein Tco_0255726 [Tanacetum coccineum]